MAGNTGEILRRPAVPPPIRVRRNVLTMPANDPILRFYGSAIAAMKTLPISNALSWRYQAAIHDYVRSEDPFAQPSDLPLPADSTTFWRNCEHDNWFFLPWHRMYLHHFEKIVLSEVIKQGGPTDWALPYWNYSGSQANAKIFPEAFRSGDLFIPQRDANANAGRPFMRGDPTNIDCLREPLFTGVPGGSPGFGGMPPPPPDTRSHGGGPGEGMVEQSPHDRIHGAINGNDRNPDNSPKPLPQRNFMGDFTRAPLDPIFWVHHCNIDRLWEVWVNMPGHANPTTPAWLNAVTFPFHDATGGTGGAMKCSDVVDTRAAPLFYIYDDISNPFSP